MAWRNPDDGRHGSNCPAQSRGSQRAFAPIRGLPDNRRAERERTSRGECKMESAQVMLFRLALGLLGSLLIAIGVVWAIGPVRLLAGLIAVPVMWAIVTAAALALWAIARESPASRTGGGGRAVRLLRDEGLSEPHASDPQGSRRDAVEAVGLLRTRASRNRTPATRKAADPDLDLGSRLYPRNAFYSPSSDAERPPTIPSATKR